MDYNEFIPKNIAYDYFVELRRTGFNLLDESTNKFVDYFTDLCEKSVENNCIAQDFIAYCYKTGVDGVLPENYEKYMSYQILAGANGNCFALEKLEFFLRAGIDKIMENTEVIKKAVRLNNINSQNGIAVISNILCEGIADELKITPEKLIKGKDSLSKYTEQKYRVYTRAMQNAIPKVLEYLAK